MNEDEITAKKIVNVYRNIQNPIEKKIFASILEKIKINPIRLNDDLTGTRVSGFRLEEKKYDAESHIDVLRKILRIVFIKYPHETDKILSILGRKNKYFSKKSNDLRMPELIRGTDIYFETNENAKSICVRCEKILKLFGMDYTSFEINYHK